MDTTADRTAPTVTVAVELCPVCASPDVHVIEPGWFAVDLDRDEIRDGMIEFACRDCQSRWD